MAQTAALGWQDVTSAEMGVAAVPEAGARSAVNVAALRTMVDALRAARVVLRNHRSPGTPAANSFES